MYFTVNNTALKKSYGFLKGGQLGPKTKFAGHQDPATSLKHMYQVWEPQGGPAALPPQSNPGQRDLLRSQPQWRPRLLLEKGRRAGSRVGWTSCHLGRPSLLPKSHSTRGCTSGSDASALHTPALLRPVALGDPLPGTASFPPNHQVQPSSALAPSALSLGPKEK